MFADLYVVSLSCYKLVILIALIGDSPANSISFSHKTEERSHQNSYAGLV